MRSICTRQPQSLTESGKVWERFGSLLSPAQAAMLVRQQEEVLQRTSRIDFNGWILEPLARAFCDSSYIQPADWPDTLAALAESILLTLGTDRDPAVLLAPDLEARFQQGQRRSRQKCALSQQLWRMASSTLPNVENRSLSDTLNSLRHFPARYDWRFFAQEIPADIDYQLSQPVPESLQGVDYVVEWLRRLCLENAFLDRFEPSLLRVLLERSCPDYRGLLINLYEPAAVNALGLTLLSEDPHSLSIAPPHQTRLRQRLSTLLPEGLEASLVTAAARLSDELDVSPPCARYLRQTAPALCPRLRVALGSNNLENTFLTF